MTQQRRSESPFDRHGERTTTETRRATYTLHGQELLFGVAHQLLGEWRQWREVADESGVADPFDLHRRTFGPASLEFPQGTAIEDDDDRILGMTADGAGYFYVHLEATGATTVDGVAATTYTLALSRDGGDDKGPPVVINDVEILAPDGSDAGGIGLTLWTPDYRDALLIRADVAFLAWVDTYSAGWVQVERGDETDTLTVPTLTLPPGRGEVA